MRSKIHVWWDESDRRPLREVSVRSSGEAEAPDSSQGRERVSNSMLGRQAGDQHLAAPESELCM